MASPGSRVPEILLTKGLGFAEDFILNCSLEQRLALWRILASLLFDPTPDGSVKFELNYFPFTGRNVRQYVNSEFLIVYTSYLNGDLGVIKIFRRADLPRRQDIWDWRTPR